jgi:hypothetical protein
MKSAIPDLGEAINLNPEFKTVRSGTVVLWSQTPPLVSLTQKDQRGCRVWLVRCFELILYYVWYWCEVNALIISVWHTTECVWTKCPHFFMLSSHQAFCTENDRWPTVILCTALNYTTSTRREHSKA